MAFNQGLMPNINYFKKMSQKETTMVKIYKEDHKDLLLFKIRSNAKNMPEAIKLLLQKMNYKEVSS